MGRAGADTEMIQASRKEQTALICVDVQNDFLPGGALAVPNGDEVIAPLVKAAEEATLVVATADMHPADHLSFASQKGVEDEAELQARYAETGAEVPLESWAFIWPDHCVEGTEGSHIHPEIVRASSRTITKGSNRWVEQYSAVQGTHLAIMLKAEGYTRLLVGGLATDYCVKATVLDALKEGFEVEVLADACRAVNVNEGDEDAAYAEMEAAGAKIRR